MIHVYGSVTRDKEKYALSALTSVCIKQVNFSEKKNEVFFGTDEIVRYIHCTLYIKRMPVEWVPMYPKPEKGTILGRSLPV